MTQKTVLVTGANSGIGLATVKKFLKNDYFIFANYNKSNKNLLKLKNKNIYTIKGDLTIVSEIKKVIRSCLSKKNRLDVLINNAAIQITSENIEDINLKHFDHVMALNTKAPYILSQLAMKQMKKQKSGRIINISSIGVKYGGNPSTASYTISKAALEAMTLLFAKSGAPFNVLVNALRVGITDTNFLKNNKKKDLKQRVDIIPLKRLGKPIEIANTIFFLASDESSYTTGSIISVAGGD